MTRQYTIREGDALQNIAIMRRLWEHGFGPQNSAEAEFRIVSQYLQNPAGSPHVYFLRELGTEEDIGLQSLVWRRYWYGNRALNAAVVADFVVHRMHRSLTPALQLAKHMKSDGLSRSAFLFGFPNKKAQVIFKRMGHSPTTFLNRYVKVLSSRFYLHRVLPKRMHRLAPLLSRPFDLLLKVYDGIALLFAQPLHWLEVASNDPRLGEVWQRAKRDDLLLSERNNATMHWRYSGLRERRFALALNGNKQPVGYVVWSADDAVVEIFDFFCRDLRTDCFSLLLGFTRHRNWGNVTRVEMELCAPKSVLKTTARAGFVCRQQAPVFFKAGLSTEATDWAKTGLFLTNFDREY